MIYKQPHLPKWKKYQASVKKSARRSQYLKKIAAFFVIAGLAAALVVMLVYLGIRLPDYFRQPHAKPPAAAGQARFRPAPSPLADLKISVNTRAEDSARLADPMILSAGGRRYFIHTAIFPKLQTYIHNTLKRSRTRQSAVVVLDPHSGRLLSMVDYDANGDAGNLCLQADFPAASLFKIVSAAAALESAGLKPDTKLYFRGRRHTLYKSQLKTKKDRWTTQTRFRKAFARSNNAVFGKIGIYDLGQGNLSRYAEKFFFNRPIAFNLPLAISRVAVPADDFGLAEISSGFNKDTLISPLHAALLAAVAVNRGNMPTPRLVDSIGNESNKVIYQAPGPVMMPAVSRTTARDLKLLMQDAVRYGTSRGTFRKLRRKKRFKNFDLGAKTGTINDRTDRFKYDWVTAFAVPPSGSGAICVSVLGVHAKLLGTRSTEMARAIVDYYFSTVGTRKAK